MVQASVNRNWIQVVVEEWEIHFCLKSIFLCENIKLKRYTDNVIGWCDSFHYSIKSSRLHCFHFISMWHNRIDPMLNVLIMTTMVNTTMTVILLCLAWHGFAPIYVLVSCIWRTNIVLCHTFINAKGVQMSFSFRMASTQTATRWNGKTCCITQQTLWHTQRDMPLRISSIFNPEMSKWLIRINFRPLHSRFIREIYFD